MSLEVTGNSFSFGHSEGKVDRTLCLVGAYDSWKVAYGFLEDGAFTSKVKPYNKQPLICSYMKFHPVVIMLTTQE